jgi:hypothetical protein
MLLKQNVKLWFSLICGFGIFLAPITTNAQECLPYYSGPLTYTPPLCCRWERCHDVFNNFSIDVAFLWWEANEDGLELGQEVCVSREDFNPATGNYVNVVKDSKLKTLKSHYNPGFKLGVTYAYPGNCWDARFEWTYFKTTASACGKSHLDNNPEPGNSYIAFVPFWEILAQNFPNIAHGKWTLDLDLFDLELGRDFCLSNCFSVRPHFGVRCAMIDQSYRVVSSANQNGKFNSASYHYTSKYKAHCNFFGVGPRLGFDAELNMCWGLSLFGKAAGSLVFGKFDRHSREHFHNTDFYYYRFENFKNHTHNKDHDYATRAITDASIGLKWDHCFNWFNRCYPVSVALSWEHHGFFNFNHFDADEGSFTNTNKNEFEFGPYANLRESQRRHGDLFTQGITLSAALGF